jgi:hypothetical protein
MPVSLSGYAPHVRKAGAFFIEILLAGEEETFWRKVPLPSPPSTHPASTIFDFMGSSVSVGGMPGSTPLIGITRRGTLGNLERAYQGGVEENGYGKISVGQPPPLNILGTEQWNQRIFSIIPSFHSGTHHEDSL